MLPVLETYIAGSANWKLSLAESSGMRSNRSLGMVPQETGEHSHWAATRIIWKLQSVESRHFLWSFSRSINLRLRGPDVLRDFLFMGVSAIGFCGVELLPDIAAFVAT
jgi:hypothetical protein